MIEFTRYPKIPRYENETWTISEKIDGSNGVIYIPKIDANGTIKREDILAGSRSQWLGELDHKGHVIDNHDFHKWVVKHWVALLQLGSGLHHGEWYGDQINRNYGLKHKTFMLFNHKRYAKLYYEENSTIKHITELETVIFSNVEFRDLPDAVHTAVDLLKTHGSMHVKGFNKPEGLILRSELRNTLYKVIIDKD